MLNEFNKIEVFPRMTKACNMLFRYFFCLFSLFSVHFTENICRVILVVIGVSHLNIAGLESKKCFDSI